jgi:hypothetical protein
MPFLDTTSPPSHHDVHCPNALQQVCVRQQAMISCSVVYVPQAGAPEVW